MDVATSPWFLALAGLLSGALLGFVARGQHFCTMSALERHWYAADSAGVRTWALAAAVALVLTQLLAATGHVDIAASFYVRSGFAWVGAILGGVAFGFGMALVGTCGFGALVRLGGGSLRSLIVLIVLGFAAMATQKGLLAPMRVVVSDNQAIDFSFAGGQSLGAILSHYAATDLRPATAAALAVLLFAWIFRDPAYRRRFSAIAAGATIGAVIAFGWLVTTYAYRHSFEIVQIEAGSFVVPVADTLMQLLAFTGRLPDYGVGLVVGVVAGSALCTFRRHDVRWEACDDARELSRHLAGASLMGIGGVFAMGCTIGQGVTAVSAMAISAPVVLASIALGARMGLAYLIEGSPFAAFRAPSGTPAE